MMRVYLGEDPAQTLRLRREARTYLNWVASLRACMGYEVHLRKFRQKIDRRNLTEFLLLDRAFPRSVGFAAQRLLDAVQAITAETSTPQSACWNVPRAEWRLNCSMPTSRTCIPAMAG
jgi:uncharacterized alpha-E superfamily protein